MNNIGIIGLGYVGLPLALEFGKKYPTVAFDLNKKRISELKNKFDYTKEVSKQDFFAAKKIKFTSNIEDLKSSNIYIVAVPTPINNRKEPDLKPLFLASKNVGKLLSDQDIVIFESTVYPGATEEFCVPILEKYSNLKFINQKNKKVIKNGFYCGYSPERINPGDKKNRITNITKVTSGSTSDVALKVDKLYKSIITAGTHMAESIKIAEASKIIENTQRDVNIALINELSIIFDKLSIDTKKVLNAASTKWNFLPFSPGLVGGHCIGVDPYYLTYKSKKIGYEPRVILSGRKINDQMPKFIFNKVKKLMMGKKLYKNNAKILFLGATFKENCPDIRNSKSIELIKIFKKSFENLYCYDPYIFNEESLNKIGAKIIKKPRDNFYDVIIITVSHKEFLRLGYDRIIKFAKKNNVVFDVKSIFPGVKVDGSL